MCKFWIKRKDIFPTYFNDKYEYKTYKYLCGERIWLRICKKKRVRHLFERYIDWGNYVTTKYEIYNKESLKEFIKYLTHRKRINGHVIDVCAKVLSALITVVFTYGIWNNIRDINFLTKDVISIIAGVIMLVIMFILLLKTILVVHSLLLKPTLKKHFYEDYIEIIEQIIETKKVDKP